MAAIKIGARSNCPFSSIPQQLRQGLTADADVNVGSAGMPSFFNFFRNAVVDVLTSLRLTPGGRQPLSILGGIKGVLKPVRVIGYWLR